MRADSPLASPRCPRALVGDRAIAAEPVFQLKKAWSYPRGAGSGNSGHKDRLTKLEEHVRAREEILVSEAKGAAAAVAASQHVADISRRLGAMEERLCGSEAARLPPPDDSG